MADLGGREPRDDGPPERDVLEPGRHLDADALPDDLARLRGIYFLHSDRECDAFDAALAEIVKLRAAALSGGSAPGGPSPLEIAAQRVLEWADELVAYMVREQKRTPTDNLQARLEALRAALRARLDEPEGAA